VGGEKGITFTRNPEKFIAMTIAKFVKENPANRRKVDAGRYWDTPLVGFASGKDPLFKQYKKIIGKFHLTPHEIFELNFGKDGRPKEVSVISWILPALEDVRKSNRIKTKFPSLLWAHTYDFGEQFNIKLRNHLVSFLKKKGYRAVAPQNSTHFKRLRSSRVGRASNWSERHIAYACGLGAFGLNDGFITSKGQAMRAGSVVTDLHLEPTKKIYPHSRVNCLYYFNNTCKALNAVRLEQSRKKAMTRINAMIIYTILCFQPRRTSTVSRHLGHAAYVRPKFHVNLKYLN
jgi:epoxyqueuosine reductase